MEQQQAPLVHPFEYTPLGELGRPHGIFVLYMSKWHPVPVSESLLKTSHLCCFSGWPPALWSLVVALACGILLQFAQYCTMLACSGIMVFLPILGPQWLAVGIAIRAPYRPDITGSSSPGGAGEGPAF